MWQTFGFKKNKALFERLTQDNLLDHAYLFTGQEMIGKRTFALELAGRVNGIAPGAEDFNRQVFSGEELNIEAVRELKRWLTLTPSTGARKIVIIDEAQTLRLEAINALLKLLEEPPRYALFLLISSQPRALLPTIASRCQLVRFTPHPLAELQTYLGGLGLDQRQAEWLANFSNGRVGLAITLKQESAFGKIKAELKQFSNLLQANIAKRLLWVAEVFDKNEPKIDLERLTFFWLLFLRSPLANSLKIDRIKVARNLLAARPLLTSTQYNRRLILENFLLSI